MLLFLKKIQVKECLFICLIFLTRLPFLAIDNGYDPDSARHAIDAQRATITGIYSTCRPPGHPLLDYVYPHFWKSGPFSLNLFAALLGMVAIVFFMKILKHLGVKHYQLLTAAFAFIPVVFINCTVTMDYMWGMAFVLGSIYYALKGNSILTGIGLALAISCRITHLCMLLPLALLLSNKTVLKNSKKILLMGIIGAAGLLSYLPSFWAGNFEFPQSMPFTLVQFVSLGFLHVWELLGLLALAIAALSILYHGVCKKTSMPFHWHNYVWILCIGLYWIPFTQLGEEAAYLIPTIPFILLLLGNLLVERILVIVCSLFILSSFLLGIQHPMLKETQTPLFSIHFHNQDMNFNLKGPIVLDHLNRIAFKTYADNVLKTFETLPKGTVIKLGWIAPRLMQSEGLKDPSVIVPRDLNMAFPDLLLYLATNRLTAEQIANIKSRTPETSVYYLKLQEDAFLKEVGGTPLPLN